MEIPTHITDQAFEGKVAIFIFTVICIEYSIDGKNKIILYNVLIWSMTKFAEHRY